MSADNWTICPRCKDRLEKDFAEKVQRIGKSYGNVSAEEYLAGLEEIKKHPHIDDTLREDYELGIWKGEFFVSYSASCDKCGFSFNFNHKELLASSIS